MERFLQGRRILVVDDDYFAAAEVKVIAEELGATVIGPVGRLDRAEALVRGGRLDGAILDVRLDGETSYALARELLGSGVPVVFLTGFAADSIDEAFREVPRISKPYDRQRDGSVLMQAFHIA